MPPNTWGALSLKAILFALEFRNMRNSRQLVTVTADEIFGTVEGGRLRRWRRAWQVPRDAAVELQYTTGLLGMVSSEVRLLHRSGAHTLFDLRSRRQGRRMAAEALANVLNVECIGQRT